MNKEVLIKKLISLGLTPESSQIYLFLLGGDPQTALHISRKLDIERTKVYRFLENLQELKLVEKVGSARGKKFKAATPENLEILLFDYESSLKQRKDILPSLIAELSSLEVSNKKPFEISHYNGVEGMKQMLWNSLSAQKEILSFGYQTKNEIVGKAFADKVRKEQVIRQITLFEIENARDQGDYWYTDVIDWGKHYQSKYISEDTLEIKQTLYIFDNTVSILHWEDSEYVGLEINNGFYAAMQRQIFWNYWNSIV